MLALNTRCETTVVDFSRDSLSIQRLNNETLPEFLDHAQADWVKCR
jgi:hypothetical protein